MIISLNEEAKEYVEQISSTFEDNLLYSDLINDYLNRVGGKETLEISKVNKITNNPKKSVERRIKELYSNDDPTFSSFDSRYGLSNVHLLDEKEIVVNPYYKKLKGLKIVNDDIHLTWSNYLPYEVFLMDETKSIEDDFYRESSPLGFFEKEVKYPLVYKDDKVWMSLIPHEINTMAKSIQEAKGKVLVLGLGLGYYPYMISLKDEVKEITILENDQSIIDIFNKYLLPLFEGKGKIKIIKIDAISYIKNINKDDFDYIFSDLWHREIDGLKIYSKIRKIFFNKQIENASFWIEESLLVYLRRYVISMLLEEMDGYQDEDYMKPKNEEDKIFSNLHFALKDKRISSIEDIDKLLSDSSLKELVTKI